MTAVLVAAALAAGYLLGRFRFGSGVTDWAEDRVAPGWRSPGFWLGAPVIVLALACVWLVHPRRSLANVRSWREEQRPDPAPVRDPDWAAKRAAAREQRGGVS